MSRNGGVLITSPFLFYVSSVVSSGELVKYHGDQNSSRLMPLYYALRALLIILKH